MNTSEGDIVIKWALEKLNKAKESEYNEPELPDDYPVYNGYMYVVDGEVKHAYCPAIG